jgi:hypothetical protein
MEMEYDDEFEVHPVHPALRRPPIVQPREKNATKVLIVLFGAMFVVLIVLIWAYQTAPVEPQPWSGNYQDISHAFTK